jgi:hypothetical protein
VTAATAAAIAADAYYNGYGYGYGYGAAPVVYGTPVYYGGYRGLRYF